MKGKILILCLIVAAGCLFAFDFKSRPQIGTRLSGVWYFSCQNKGAKDIDYGEAIFTESHYWTYAGFLGVYYQKYYKTGDSLFLVGRRGNYLERYKQIPINSDEFVLENELGKYHYYRLDLPIDTSRLIHDDEELLSIYLKDFEKRRDSWLKKNGSY